MKKSPATEPPGTKCPTCRENRTEHDSKFWPFCSERCRLVDLGKWLNQDYAVARPIRPGELSDDELSE